MKAYSIWRMAKWKDYIDLFFIIKEYWIDKIMQKAKNIFRNDFSE